MQKNFKYFQVLASTLKIHNHINLALKINAKNILKRMYPIFLNIFFIKWFICSFYSKILFFRLDYFCVYFTKLSPIHAIYTYIIIITNDVFKKYISSLIYIGRYEFFFSMEFFLGIFQALSSNLKQTPSWISIYDI